MTIRFTRIALAVAVVVLVMSAALASLIEASAYASTVGVSVSARVTDSAVSVEVGAIDQCIAVRPVLASQGLHCSDSRNGTIFVVSSDESVYFGAAVSQYRQYAPDLVCNYKGMILAAIIANDLFAAISQQNGTLASVPMAAICSKLQHVLEKQDMPALPKYSYPVPSWVYEQTHVSSSSSSLGLLVPPMGVCMGLFKQLATGALLECSESTKAVSAYASVADPVLGVHTANTGYPLQYPYGWPVVTCRGVGKDLFLSSDVFYLIWLANRSQEPHSTRAAMAAVASLCVQVAGSPCS